MRVIADPLFSKIVDKIVNRVQYPYGYSLLWRVRHQQYRHPLYMRDAFLNWFSLLVSAL
jgi:hypothetical protein